MKGALLAALALTLTACVPTGLRAAAPTTPAPVAALQAAYSDAGVVAQEGGAVSVWLYPGFVRQGVPLPGAVTQVGWQGSGNSAVAWAALPGPGLLVTLTGRPLTLTVGRVAALSSARVYLQGGAALSYDNQPATPLGRTLGRSPQAAVTGGDGQEYVLVGGQLYGGAADRPLDGRGAVLYATPQGAAVASQPTAQLGASRYVLTGEALERRDLTGRLLASVPSRASSVGVVAGNIVTVGTGGVLRVYRSDLS